MNTEWKTRIFKITIWLAAEVTLNLLGMDTMADYGEFVLGQDAILAEANQPAIVLWLR